MFRKVLLIAAVLLPAFFSCNRANNDAAAEKNLPPLTRLLQGNERFSQLRSRHPDEDLEHRLKEAEQQHPFAVVVTCSDSRLSPELIFDQGIGDLFVIRTAGNIISGVEMGSIEYAVEHLGVQLVVVMGHENCGAVKAYVEGGDAPGHIRDIVDSLRQEAEVKAIPMSDAHRLEHTIDANIRHGLRQLHEQSPLLQERIQNGKLTVAGLRYNLHNFKVQPVTLN